MRLTALVSSIWSDFRVRAVPIYTTEKLITCEGEGGIKTYLLDLNLGVISNDYSSPYYIELKQCALVCLPVYQNPLFFKKPFSGGDMRGPGKSNWRKSL